MSLWVWQLVVLALVVGVLVDCEKAWWRNRGGSHLGSFRWWKQNRRGGWWW